jgi:serine/threonine protein kinase, bacterial
MMRVKTFFLLPVAAMVLAACGGGSGSDPVPATKVAGIISKGPVDGADCKLYSSGNQVLASAKSAAGAFDFGTVTGVTANAADGYYVQCMGGSYTDEATGQSTTNSGILGGAPLAGSKDKRIAIITPLSQLAWQQAGKDPAKLSAAAANVAKAFGIAGVDILNTTPSDLNTKTAGTDAAGQYGTVLAAIAQYQKNTSQNLTTALSTLNAALGGRASLAGAQSAQYASALLDLGNSAQNNNANVRANINATQNASMGTNANNQSVADGQTTAPDLQLGLSQTTVQLGSSASVTATATSTSTATKTYSSSNTAVASIDTNGAITAVGAGTTTISVSQVASGVYTALSKSATLTVTARTAPTAAWDSTKVTSNAKSIQIGDAQNYTATATFSCSSESSYNPTVTYSSSAPATATVNSTTGAVTNLAAGQSTITANVPQQGTCSAQSTQYTLTVTAFPTPTITGVAISSDTTVAGKLVAGGQADGVGGGKWIISGTGLAGYVLKGKTIGAYTAAAFGNTTCKAAGTVSTDGTSITGVDCTNASTAASDTSATISAALSENGTPSTAISLAAAPAPTFTVSASPSTLQLGSTATSILSASTGGSNGVVTYTSGDTQQVSVSGTSASLASGANAGSVTISASLAADPGRYASATAVASLTVSARTMPTGGFDFGIVDGGATVTLGAATSTPGTANFSCTTESSYKPSISYSSSDSKVATVDSSTGAVTNLAGGTSTITATAAQRGTCAGQTSSYTLTVNKAKPTLGFADNNSVSIAVGGSNVKVASVTGLNSPLPSASNLVLTYTSSDTTVATVDSTGKVTAVKGGSATITVTLAGDANYLGTSDDSAIKASYTVTVLSGYTVGGTLSGLASGASVVIKNTFPVGSFNSSESITLNANGSFTFKTALGVSGYTGNEYTVTVTTQPTGQTCTVSKGSGTVSTSNITDVAVSCTSGNTGTVTTLAGSGTIGSADGQGMAASFNGVRGVAVDSSGNVYVAEYTNAKIRKIDSSGYVTTLAGSGTQASLDGKGMNAQFSGPRGVAVDSAGNVYVAEYFGHKIRKIDSEGNVTTLAGSGRVGSADGQGAAASFNAPTGLAVDGSGNVYVADISNNKIRKIDSSGLVTTLAGSGTSGSADGQGMAATFNRPQGLAIDGSGNLYVADTSNHTIRKIDSSGNVTTLAGSGLANSVDGQGTAASFSTPNGVAVDSAGNLYVSDGAGHKIRKIDSSGKVTTLAGSGTSGSVDGQGTAASFASPFGVAVDSAGNLYVSDSGAHKIRMIK